LKSYQTGLKGVNTLRLRKVVSEPGISNEPRDKTGAVQRRGQVTLEWELEERNESIIKSIIVVVVEELTEKKRETGRGVL
jgi:hypothetical protein